MIAYLSTQQFGYPMDVFNKCNNVTISFVLLDSVFFHGFAVSSSDWSDYIVWPIMAKTLGIWEGLTNLWAAV